MMISPGKMLYLYCWNPLICCTFPLRSLSNLSESSDESRVESITILTFDKFSSPLVTTDVIDGAVKLPLLMALFNGGKALVLPLTFAFRMFELLIFVAFDNGDAINDRTDDVDTDEGVAAVVIEEGCGGVLTMQTGFFTVC